MTEIEIFAAGARRLLEDVKYLNYEWEVREDPDLLKQGLGHGILIRARYLDADIYTGKEEMQYTAWASISIQSGLSRVVSGAMKLALTSAEHRCREAFTFKGRRVFGPHFAIEDLYDLCQDREDAGH